MSQQTTTVSTPIPALANPAPPASFRNGAPAAAARKLLRKVRTWRARSAQRRALSELAESNNQHLLNDIGVTREQAQRTAAKWFWQP